MFGGLYYYCTCVNIGENNGVSSLSALNVSFQGDRI